MTDKIHTQETVKITVKPFLVIAALLTILIFIGSIANKIRMEKRFDSLVDHSNVIYNAHSAEIESLVSGSSNIESVLDRINQPEKGVYYIDLILVFNGSWTLYDDQGPGLNLINLSQEYIDLIQNYVDLDNNKKFNFQNKLKDFYGNFYKPYPNHNKDFLISIIRIDQNSETVGYFVVATSKVQSN